MSFNNGIDTETKSESDKTNENEKSTPSWKDLEKTGQTNLSYAECFTIEKYGDGYSLVTIENDKYLITEEGYDVPSELPDDYVVIKKPLTSTYVASSSVMDFYRQLGSLSDVKMVSTKAENWSIPEVKDAIENSEIEYIGKYNAPDYEKIVNNDTGLAIENTMIYHNPETKEKLEDMGIPVIVERSSYEKSPLGRMEWIKLYGLLSDKEKEADEFFDSQIELIDSLSIPETDMKVAFFFITGNGAANVRKPSDYIPKIIDIAGGIYSPSDIETSEDDNRSTMNMQMEDFYSKTSDADIIIYNSTIDSDIYTKEELFDKSELLRNFTAVKNDNCWCTNQDVFQKSTCACQIIKEINLIILNKAEDEDLEFFHRIK